MFTKNKKGYPEETQESNLRALLSGFGKVENIEMVFIF